MYPYFVQHIGSRGRGSQKESGAEVVQASTGNMVQVCWTSGSANVASLLAETECAKLNAPTAALDFAERLSLFMERVGREEHSSGELVEDMGRIVNWHIKRLRGLSREPLEWTGLFHQAPEFS